MLKNRPTNPAVKSTLILAPLALLDQWKMEIEMKTNAGLKVLIYHGMFHVQDWLFSMLTLPRLQQTSQKEGCPRVRYRSNHVLREQSFPRLSVSRLHAIQTMALEWPDFEAQAKKKKAAKRRRQKETGFIVPDSDESSDEGSRGKGKRNKNERKLTCHPGFIFSVNRCSGYFVPDRCTSVLSEP